MIRRLPDSRSGSRARIGASLWFLDILRRLWAHVQDFLASYPAVMSFGVVCLSAFVCLLAIDSFERAPRLTVYVGSAFLMIALPALLVWRHRQRQAAVVRRIRTLYAMAEAMIASGQRGEASRILSSIERWERHWRLGNSTLYCISYSAVLLASTFSMAAVHYVAYIHEYSRIGYDQQPHETLMQTVNELILKPGDLYWVLGLSVMAAIAAAGHLRDLKEEPWASFYGAKLRQLLSIGRGVGNYVRRARNVSSGEESARELLGLPATFTAAELRRAWLRLARELHPDRWGMAPASVRIAKEEALKSVNAAKDELERKTL